VPLRGFEAAPGGKSGQVAGGDTQTTLLTAIELGEAVDTWLWIVSTWLPGAETGASPGASWDN